MLSRGGRYALLAALAAAASTPALAQSTFNSTYTAIASSATAAHLNAGAVVVGFADVRVTTCARNFCRVRMLSATPPAGGILTYINAAEGAATPLASACSASGIAVTSSPDLVLTVTQGQVGGRRIFFCYSVSWLTALTTYAPPVQFTLTHSNS